MQLCWVGVGVGSLPHLPNTAKIDQNIFEIKYLVIYVVCVVGCMKMNESDDWLSWLKLEEMRERVMRGRIGC